MPTATATEDGIEILDREIAELIDQQHNLQEQAELAELEVERKRRQAGRAREKGDDSEANRLDSERVAAASKAESVAEALDRVTDRLDSLKRARDRRAARDRVDQLVAEIRDLAESESDAWSDALDHLTAGLEALRTVRKARVEHAARREEVRLLTGLFDNVDEPEVPDTVDGDEFVERLDAVRDAKRETASAAEMIRADCDADSLAASVSAVLRHPPGRAGVYRTARSIWSKLTDATREAAERAITGRLRDHYNALDAEAQEGTISPSGGTS